MMYCLDGFKEIKLGRQAAWRLDAFVLCRHIGWWHCSRKSNSVVKLLGGRGAFGLVSSLWLVALFKEVKLGRQAAWRPGAFRLVSSHWLVALFKEIKLGRQAAWRPGAFELVSSQWTKSNSVVKLLGGRGAIGMVLLSWLVWLRAVLIKRKPLFCQVYP